MSSNTCTFNIDGHTVTAEVSPQINENGCIVTLSSENTAATWLEAMEDAMGEFRSFWRSKKVEMEYETAGQKIRATISARAQDVAEALNLLERYLRTEIVRISETWKAMGIGASGGAKAGGSGGYLG